MNSCIMNLVTGNSFGHVGSKCVIFMFLIVKINFLYNENWNSNNIKTTQKWQNKAIRATKNG